MCFPQTYSFCIYPTFLIPYRVIICYQYIYHTVHFIHYNLYHNFSSAGISIIHRVDRTCIRRFMYQINFHLPIMIYFWSPFNCTMLDIGLFIFIFYVILGENFRKTAKKIFCMPKEDRKSIVMSNLGKYFQLTQK